MGPSLHTPPVTSYVVSGILSETVDGLSRPLAGLRVDLWIDQGSTYPAVRRRQNSITDHNGRYTAQVPKSRVFVMLADHYDGTQPCLASAAVDKDTTIDVQVVPAGSTPPMAASPMITGFVYETTPQGRNPVRGAGVWLDASGDEVFVAWTGTDAGGRFFLCRVNAPVLVGVSASGYQTSWSQSIPGTGDMFFEIELRQTLTPSARPPAEGRDMAREQDVERLAIAGPGALEQPIRRIGPTISVCRGAIAVLPAEIPGHPAVP